MIAGSPDRLNAADVDLLERFVRTRGGTLIVLPDRAPGGVAARLFQRRWTEHLEATPSPTGALRASETLRRSGASPFDIVPGHVKGSPVIVLSPAGNGRIVVSGAMDAWRYRDADGGAFDRFWRSLVLESASAGSSLTLDFASPIAAPAAVVPFVVRYRRMDAATNTDLTATATCGDGVARAVRLWPDGADDVFSGTVDIEGTEPCRLRVTVEGGASVVGGIAVTSGATHSVNAVLAKLERAVSRTSRRDDCRR